MHGLDLAAGLHHRPWMAPAAAGVTEQLLLSAASAARLRAQTGWDQVTLIAALTGRRPVTMAENQLIQALGIQGHALGGR